MTRSRLRPGRGPRNRGSDRLQVEPLEPRQLLSKSPSVAHFAVARATTVHATSLSSPVLKPFNNPPYKIEAGIAEGYDPGGTGHIFQRKIQVKGRAVGYSAVSLAIGARGYFTDAVRADPDGYYSFDVIAPPGNNVIRVFGENTIYKYSEIATVPTFVSDPIVNWDSLALKFIRDGDVSAPKASRDLALLHLAQYDAVMAVVSPNDAYQVHVAAPAGASAEAAASAAAKAVLDGLFPKKSDPINYEMNQAIAALPNTKGVRDGFVLGQEVGQATLAARSDDGTAKEVYFSVSKVPGLWRPTLPGKYGAQDAEWGLVKPFALASGSQFRPPAPPSVGSAAYDAALAEVATLGRKDSPYRSADQSDAAKFWADGYYSQTDPGHWNQIAEDVAVQKTRTLAENARLFARLDVALADTAIATQDAKATYGTWRPSSAIQEFDSTWLPYASSRPSPSYVSGNAAYGAAAAAILTSEFGPKVGFTDTLNDSSALTRTFTSFAAAAAEDGQSRIWAGDSFGFDVTQGQALGQGVGSYVLAQFPKGK